MMTKKPQLVLPLLLPLLLLATSVLTVYPAMTLEKPQSQASSGTVTINVSGQAFPVSGKSKKTGAGVTATLTLSGSTRSEGDGELKLGGLSGSLVIDTATYTITGGNGEISKNGKAEIDARTALTGVPTMPDGARNLELVLHGSIQGTNVVFTSQESKLSSLYFLSLTGQAVFTQSTTTTTNTSGHNGDKNPTTVTVTQHDTATQTVTETQQSTVTTTESVDHTVTETVTETVTLTGTSSVVTVTETTTTTVTTT
jgi:hypothetical protein